MSDLVAFPAFVVSCMTLLGILLFFVLHQRLGWLVFVKQKVVGFGCLLFPLVIVITILGVFSILRNTKAPDFGILLLFLLSSFLVIVLSFTGFFPLLTAIGPRSRQRLRVTDPLPQKLFLQVFLVLALVLEIGIVYWLVFIIH